MTTTFNINGRTSTTHGAPVVVICIDGSEPKYHLEAVRAGRLPWLAGVLRPSGAGNGRVARLTTTRQPSSPAA